jgi:hypothetical protein
MNMENYELLRMVAADFDEEIARTKKLRLYFDYQEYGTRFIIIKASEWDINAKKIQHSSNSDKAEYIYVLDLEKQKAFFTTVVNIQLLYDKIISYGKFYELVVNFFVKNQYDRDLRQEAYIKISKAIDMINNHKEKELAPLERKAIKGLIKYEDEFDKIIKEYTDGF